MSLVKELGSMAWSDPLSFYSEIKSVEDIDFVISRLGSGQGTYGLVKEIDLEFPPLGQGPRDLWIVWGDVSCAYDWFYFIG